MWHLSGPLTEGIVIFGDNCRRFLANSGHFCCHGAILWCKKPLLSTNRFTQGHLLKIAWLFADVTHVVSPDRAEWDILGVILGIFWPIQDHLMKIKWLVTTVTAVRSSDSRTCHFGDDFGFFGQFRPFCRRGAILRCRKPLLIPNDFT